MASIALSVVGGSLGGGPFVSALGSQLGSVVGAQLDNRLFGDGKNVHREGPRLAELSVQTSTYGKMIPLVYGNARIAGNVIWSRPIKEVGTTTTTSQGGKGGGGPKSSATEFSYFITLAIAICAGEVNEIQRAWADAKQLDLSLGTYRFYRGGEDQLPDSLIESFEGVGATPAYRGLCYVVIEDFPLADFGNRIPNFTFEVKKKILWPDVDGEALENLVTGMVLIPGSGEFVYDTQVQQKVEGEVAGGDFAQRGYQMRINMHNPSGAANALLALDQLEETCPNVNWVAFVVNWFGDSLDAGACIIKPGVEFGAAQATTQPEVWSVAGYNRGTARQITYVDDSPRYGGTPDDQSVLRCLDELKNRGYNIFFLPMFLMDMEDKPWRGRVTGTTTTAASFFTKPEGYNAFVLHYANLVKDHVDAFAIGSELIGLTKVNNGAGVGRVFPAVSALVSLAASVKALVGSGVKVTYAADWSEYHHTDNGWYNMDPLWASANIDVVGIDAYFPITKEPQNAMGYDIQKVVDGWTKDEGWDYYYTDPGRTTTAPLSAAYAWKNIDWWWNHTHVNPDGAVTAWTVQAKKIWFTEFGFPSVDGASNQPNVFYDPTSSESYFPYLSRGRVDFLAQRMGIAGTVKKWQGSAMVERMFLWTWDARPFPYWPDLLSVWADGGVWKTGHWVQGKLGLSSLAAIVADISQKAGLVLPQIDVSRLLDRVEGYVVTRQSTARELIEQLMAGYFFDATETDGVIKFVLRGNAPVATIQADRLLPGSTKDSAALSIVRAQELELPQVVEVQYINRLTNYQAGTQRSQRQVTRSRDVLSIGLPIVMADQRAKIIADIALYNGWMERTRYQFDVPMQYADLEPADVIEVQASGATHTLRITQMQLGRPGMVRVSGVAEDVSVYDFNAPPAVGLPVAEEPLSIADTRLLLLDIPALITDGADDAPLRFAASGLGSGWRGSAVYRTDDGGGSFHRLAVLNQPCVMGTAVTALRAANPCIFDEDNHLDVVLLGTGSLSSASKEAVLNGANMAHVGEEIIQFRTAIELTTGKYRLSRLLRGRFGTEWAMDGHSQGERFVLLDGSLQTDRVADGLIGLGRNYKAVSLGKTLGQSTTQLFTYTGRALKPYAPVHVSGARDSSGNLTVKWVRRTRVGGNWKDGTDAPLSEAKERYSVDILDGSLLVRTVEVSSPLFIYDAAMQVADFGAVQPAVNLVVYQVSERVGRGYGTARAV